MINATLCAAVAAAFNADPRDICVNGDERSGTVLWTDTVTESFRCQERHDVPTETNFRTTDDEFTGEVVIEFYSYNTNSWLRR
jgi:hypothetical protein